MVAKLNRPRSFGDEANNFGCIGQFGCFCRCDDRIHIASSGKGRCERIQDAIGHQLEYSRAYYHLDGDVRAAEDVKQALEIFEANLLPTLTDRVQSRVDHIRSRIAGGKSWTYVVTEEDQILFYLVELVPRLTNHGYGFPYLVSVRDSRTGEFALRCENLGLLELLPRECIPEAKIQLSAYEEYCSRLPLLKDAIGKVGDVCQYAPDNPSDVSAIVDVTDVELVSVDGVDYQRRRAGNLLDCRGAYRVRMDVRKIVRGQLPSDILILEVNEPWGELRRELEWLYYRGMSLRITIHPRRGELLLVDAIPVEPYPPYSNDSICISGGALVGGFSADEFEGKVEPLVVQYGTHTKVEYECGDVIIKGHRASFPDFGVTSKFRILELKDGANKAYWENAWFNPKNNDLE